MYYAKEVLENFEESFEPDGSDKDSLIIKLYLALQEAVAEIDKYREYGEGWLPDEEALLQQQSLFPWRKKD